MEDGWGMGMGDMGMGDMGMCDMGMGDMGMCDMGMGDMGMGDMGMGDVPDMGMDDMGLDDMPDMGMDDMGLDDMPDMGTEDGDDEEIPEFEDIGGVLGGWRGGVGGMRRMPGGIGGMRGPARKNAPAPKHRPVKQAPVLAKPAPRDAPKKAAAKGVPPTSVDQVTELLRRGLKITDEEYDDYKREFRKMDKNNSGFVNIDELMAWKRRKNPDYPASRLQKLMEKMDADGNGKVDFNEYLAFRAREKESEKKTGNPKGKTDKTKDAEALRRLLKISDEDFEDYKREFRKMDKNNSGFVNIDELMAWKRRKNPDYPVSRLMRLMEKMDADGNGKVDFNEYLAFRAREKESEKKTGNPKGKTDKTKDAEALRRLLKISDEDFEAYKREFRKMDKNNSGFVNIDELMAWKRRKNPDYPVSRLQRLMEKMDADGNGKVDFKEFLTFMASRP